VLTAHAVIAEYEMGAVFPLPSHGMGGRLRAWILDALRYHAPRTTPPADPTNRAVYSLAPAPPAPGPNPQDHMAYSSSKPATYPWPWPSLALLGARRPAQAAPTPLPSAPTPFPTKEPTKQPTKEPTKQPTKQPSHQLPHIDGRVGSSWLPAVA
jgi:hypothetical protein